LISVSGGKSDGDGARTGCSIATTAVPGANTDGGTDDDDADGTSMETRMAAYTTAPTMVMPTADQVKTTPVPTALTMATQTKAAPAATNLANTMLAMTETAKEVPTPTTTDTDGNGADGSHDDPQPRPKHVGLTQGPQMRRPFDDVPAAGESVLALGHGAAEGAKGSSTQVRLWNCRRCRGALGAD